jgi:hypothetical protein
VRLNETLGHFYVDVRKPDGSKYKATSFESIRNGINRYLKSPPHNKPFDIVKDSRFTDANINFRAQMAEMKRMGLAVVDHHPAIYTSMYTNPETALGLANKVQFDIRLYLFFRRGMENIVTCANTQITLQ